MGKNFGRVLIVVLGVLSVQSVNKNVFAEDFPSAVPSTEYEDVIDWLEDAPRYIKKLLARSLTRLKYLMNCKWLDTLDISKTRVSEKEAPSSVKHLNATNRRMFNGLYSVAVN